LIFLKVLDILELNILKQQIKEKQKMKRIALLIIVVFSLAVLSGCNTMQGLGKDIKEAGEAIEDAAD
jgi:entericidin A